MGRDSVSIMRNRSAFFVFCLLFWITACGPGGQNAPAIRSGAAGAETPDGGEAEGARQEEEQASVEPNVPFAMMGGGPRHLNRAEVPGPRTAPVEIARFQCGARVFASPVIGPDGTIYVGSVDGTLNALRSDGKLRWSYVCDEPIFSTAAVSQTGTVYVGCDDDTLMAFSTEGTQRWTYSMKHDVDSAPVIGADGVVYVGGEGLHAIRANGKRHFKAWLGGHVSASPAVRPDGTVVVGSHDHRVYAVQPDGTVVWTFATKGPVQGPVAVFRNNDITFGSDDGYVYRLAPLGGARWKFKTDGPVRAGVAISKDSKTVFAASMDGSIYGIDASNGKKRWQVTTAGSVRASPMLDSEGLLFIGSHDHHLYAIEAETGELKWRIDLGSEIDSTAAIAAGRKLIVGADDGAIRIFEEAP